MKSSAREFLAKQFSVVEKTIEYLTYSFDDLSSDDIDHLRQFSERSYKKLSAATLYKKKMLFLGRCITCGKIATKLNIRFCHKHRLAKLKKSGQQ